MVKFQTVEVSEPEKDIKPESPKTIQKLHISKEKIFIESNKDTLLDALYNVINTIKNKKEVISQDLSKKYYRDYLKYNKTLKELQKI